jgi:tetratricopeptide (TPR) repeat protein
MRLTGGTPVLRFGPALMQNGNVFRAHNDDGCEEGDGDDVIEEDPDDIHFVMDITDDEKPAAETTPDAQPADAEDTVKVSQELIDWARAAAVSLLLRQEKYDEVIARADAYVAMYPKAYMTASAYRQMMSQRLRDREYIAANFRNPVISLLLLKSNALMELDRTDDAIASYERAYGIDPDNPGINNDLGYHYADLGINLDKAERMIRKALADKYEPAYADSLAWVFYKQGKFEQADRIFDQLFANDSEDHSEHAILYDHAGDVAWRLGDKDKAKTLWTKALDAAKNEKRPSSDTKKVLALTQQKLDALDNNQDPPVAELGKDVTPGQSREEEQEASDDEEDEDDE